MTHNYTTDQLRAIATKVMLNNPNYQDLDGGPDSNGLNFCIDIYCELPGREGALWRQVRHFIATNATGLLDRTPSPDNVLRRGREVREQIKKRDLVQPPISWVKPEVQATL